MASYDELIFQVGDLARDRLPGKPTCPRSMDRVYRAEEALVALRDELAALEQQLNDEDYGYQDFLAAQDDERPGLLDTVKRHKRVVDALDGRVKDLHKRIASRKAELRYQRIGIRQEERKLERLEIEDRDPRTIETVKANLKKLRLQLMRGERDCEDWEREFDVIMTPRPGQVGAEGILAQKRLMQMEDEASDRKEQNAQLMADLEKTILDKDQEVKAAEEFLDQALYLLGEDCYSRRINDPELVPFYRELNRMQG
ncbi:MAG: hypothetical protein FJ086_12060 [Deltaproteobacteria bacterium]|nr:hypothetical protein [Deltaproteobacteria bacterium]